jgi:tetratricopeptide (TPR) repeat protein
MTQAKHRARKPDTTEPAPPTLSHRKNLVFSTIMFLLPIAFIATLEAMLRLFAYGGNLDLVVRKTIAGQEYYAINRAVARRYFSQPGSIIPEPADETFAVRKKSNTKRIFCLGESTMAGFPYEFHATAPGFLRDRLQRLLPTCDVEVINVGLSAVGSHIVRDFMDELMDYEPDMFIVYVGHNEFYGAYGVGSSVAVRGGTWLTRVTIHLLKFKTFLLLRDIYTRIQVAISPAPLPGRGVSMMGQMVGTHEIPYGGEMYHQAREVYLENLEGMIQNASDHHVPIIFSTLVSNIRGQQPFRAMFDSRTTHDKRKRCEQLVTDGTAHLSRGNYVAAINEFRSAIAIDSLNAQACFGLGSALFSFGRYTDAGPVLARAKDLDGLRFRATEEFQNDLIRLCRARGVPLARADSAFSAASPHGIVGNELILEHLHPTLDGYFLMGKVFFQAVRQSDLLVAHNEWAQDRELVDSVYMEQSAVSEFDRTVGSVKVELLMRRWPFHTGATDFEFTAKNSVESVAFRYIQKGIAWSDARYLLAEYYAQNRRFAMARKECLAVARQLPFSYQPLLRRADYYRMEGKNDSAYAAYLECIKSEDNPFARMKLAIVELEREQPSRAVQQIESAFSVEQRTPYKFSPQAAASARYLLGVAYAKLGNIARARENLQRAIAIDPSNTDARQLLDQISH